MNPRHAHVVHALDGVAEHFRCDGGFFGYGKIGGAGADDEDAVVLDGGRAFERDAAGGFVMDGPGNGVEDGARRFGRDAGDQQAVRAFGELRRDADDLLDGFTFAEDDFWRPVAEGAVVVEFGVADVFVREVAQRVEGGVDVGVAVGNGGEEIAQALFVDGDAPVRGWCPFILARAG